jgi:hypothetical protein
MKLIITILLVILALIVFAPVNTGFYKANGAWHFCYGGHKII